jgi:ATP adenylyltransferase
MAKKKAKKIVKKIAKKKSGGAVEKTSQGHRQILMAPWRLKYIKGADVSRCSLAICVFCEALKKGPSLESLILWSGQTCSIYLNKYPYNNGHLMVIPHRHTADFGALSEKEFSEIHAALKKAHDILIEAYKPQGLNIGMNLGRAGGAGIADHLHYHLVPRWGGDTNFMPVLADTKVISETLSQTYEKLLPLT